MKFTATPDCDVGTACEPPGIVMAKFDPCGAEVGEAAAPVVDN
jgi:hypothetical protein